MTRLKYVRLWVILVLAYFLSRLGFLGESMNYINELGNKVLSELAGMKNFFKNKFKDGENFIIDPLDMKLFFVF
jgi:hypothetical protein